MRGTRATKTIEEAERCARMMGYHWLKNTIPELPFDALIFRNAVIIAVRVKKIRHSIDETSFIEQKYPDEVEGLRLLPLPAHVIRELWIRTQNERAWRRFIIFKDTTAEIGFNHGDGYSNPHFRKDEWLASLDHTVARYSISTGDEEK
jgi:hypothetical protein